MIEKVSTLLMFGATGDLARRMLSHRSTGWTRTGFCRTT